MTPGISDEADVPCPHCGGAIKKAASICKHCKETIASLPATPLHQSPAKPSAHAVSAPPTNRRRSPLEGRIGWVIVCVLVVAIGGYVALQMPTQGLGDAGWSPEQSKRLLQICEEDNASLDVKNVNDCECELRDMKSQKITFASFVAASQNEGTPKMTAEDEATLGMASRIRAACRATAALAQWTDAHQKTFMTKCPATGVSYKECDCVLGELITRNWSEERLNQQITANKIPFRRCFAQ